jgi:hypothetical protein
MAVAVPFNSGCGTSRQTGKDGVFITIGKLSGRRNYVEAINPKVILFGDLVLLNFDRSGIENGLHSDLSYATGTDTALQMKTLSGD